MEKCNHEILPLVFCVRAVGHAGDHCSVSVASGSVVNSAQHNAHLTPESLASSQAVVNASALEQSDGDTPPAQAQVA